MYIKCFGLYKYCQRKQKANKVKLHKVVQIRNAALRNKMVT